MDVFRNRIIHIGNLSDAGRTLFIYQPFRLALRISFKSEEPNHCEKTPLVAIGVGRILIGRPVADIIYQLCVGDGLGMTVRKDAVHHTHMP